MQKRGQDACPQCRSAVVLRANGCEYSFFFDFSSFFVFHTIRFFLYAICFPFDICSSVLTSPITANLDQALQEYLKLWFPKEVKAKEKANGKESAKEELMEMGISDHRCVVQ